MPPSKRKPKPGSLTAMLHPPKCKLCGSEFTVLIERPSDIAAKFRCWKCSGEFMETIRWK